MTSHFKKVALVAPNHIDEVSKTLTQLIQFLQRKKISITCEKRTASLITEFTLPTVDQEEFGKDCDLIIVVGGDGSMLRATKNAAQYNIPIVAINRGKLGFLTDIRPNEIDTRLANVLEGKFLSDKRFFLHASLNTPKENFDCGVGLNDIVLSTGYAPHMLEFEIYINNNFVCSHRADGLILATPTGSTAYSLSGGGPIIYPSIDAIVLLTMFSHTLSNRPIVVPGDTKIRIEFSSHNKIDARLSCDGINITPVPPGSSIHIQKHSQTIRLIHPLDYNYYEALRSKLYWGQKLS